MTEPRTRAGRLLLDKNTSRDTATNEWLLNDILAIEREAAPLDVDRLARAIDASWSDLLAPLGGQPDGLRRSAERVAAEYAGRSSLKEAGGGVMKHRSAA